MPVIAVEEDDDDVLSQFFGTATQSEGGPLMAVNEAEAMNAEMEILTKAIGCSSSTIPSSSSDPMNTSLGASNNTSGHKPHRNMSGIVAVERSNESNFILEDPLNLSLSKHNDVISRSNSKSISSLIMEDPLNLSLSKHSNKSNTPLHTLNTSIGKSNHSAASRNKRNISTELQLNHVTVVPKMESIDNKYSIDYTRIIGMGSNAVVRKCIQRSTSKRYAVKSVRINDKAEYEHMRNEVNLLTALDHPSIVKVYDVFQDNTHLHMVTELCKGGELYDHVMAQEKNGRYYDEQAAAVIVYQVVDAVAYLHEHNIVHRDLKLENILFQRKFKKNRYNTDVKVIDFGLSKLYNTHHRYGSLQKLTSFVGTKFYVAPEVLNHSYTHAADLWSLGVLAYALLSARAPFSGRNNQELYHRILTSQGVDFPGPEWDHVSQEAKSFISSLLTQDAAARPSACEIMEHPWMIQAHQWKQEMENDENKNSNKGLLGKLFGFGRSKKQQQAQ